MRKCGLKELKKYCWEIQPSKYIVDIKHHLRATFNCVEISTFPDYICFKSSDGNCLSIYGITHIWRSKNVFKVSCDYYGIIIEIEIICIS